jgi:hypothetical protein
MRSIIHPHAKDKGMFETVKHTLNSEKGSFTRRSKIKLAANLRERDELRGWKKSF